MIFNRKLYILETYIGYHELRYVKEVMVLPDEIIYSDSQTL